MCTPGGAPDRLYLKAFLPHRGVAKISWRGEGGSKLVLTKTVGLKSLHYIRKRIYVTQTDDALVAVERTCLSLPRYLCLGDASSDSHSLDMVDLRYIFNLLSVLNERSHSADVIGNVHKIWIKVWMLGNNSRSHAASV